jgi:FixJ family two-component response regulator
MVEAVPMVFVVDDEECVRKALGRLLRAAGYDVAVFSSAREFLAQRRPDVPACLLLDVAMPEMSGLELQQALGSGDTAWQIIFLTGQDDSPSSDQARSEGSIEFFAKPVEDDNLLAAVATAIQKDRDVRIGRCSRET